MLDRIADLARAGGRMAVDTEFMSERRYRAMLCLAQVAVADPDAPDGVATAVIDPLAGDEPGQVVDALADPSVEVVVHAGRQDVAILRRSWSTTVTNVFDTQVAAGFLGYGPQESYRSLVDRVLGVQIEAAESFTRWERRPLTGEQLRYAAEDAHHLLDLGGELERALEEAGRLVWARAECRSLEDASDERLPEAVFARLPGVGRLNARARAVAAELVRWREEQALAADRNPGSLLPDHVLVEIARRPPRNPEALGDVRGLPEGTRHRRGRELLAAARRGAEKSAPQLPRAAPRPSRHDAVLVGLVTALVRHTSLRSGIAGQLIATQDDMARLVAAVRGGEADPDLTLVRGWRRQLVGEQLLDLLAGRLALTVGEGLELQVGAPAAA